MLSHRYMHAARTGRLRGRSGSTDCTRDKSSSGEKVLDRLLKIGAFLFPAAVRMLFAVLADNRTVLDRQQDSETLSKKGHRFA